MEKVALGLKANWKQFTLLVLINGFVGGMVGLERTILPTLAEQEFGLAAKSAILSFIVVFGVTKAMTNYFTGALANRVGRKNLLVLGWLVGLPVPLLLIYAPSWGWVIFANGLLGINQGLTWSSTVVMKIDLVGQQNRGLAMGINESAGYIAVGAVAFLSGWIAAEYGIRPYPFYLGIAFALIGLLSSWLLVRDTGQHVQAEAQSSTIQPLQRVFWETSWKHPNLGAITQAGLVNNLNDGMVWGLFPILLSAKGFELTQIAQLVAIYPLVWGLAQLVTGKAADHLPKKPLLFWGMLLQGAAIVLMVFAEGYLAFAGLSVVLGLGTAIVYPTFLAAIADNTHPQQRAKSIGVFRLWRDLGYAIGAVLTGVVADIWSSGTAVLWVGGLTLLSAGVIVLRMNHRNDPNVRSS
jgi:MFS family permease